MRKLVPIGIMVWMGVGGWLWPGAAGAETFEVGLTGDRFVPPVVGIEEGDSIRWLLVDGAHTVTSGASSAPADNPGQLFDHAMTSLNPTFIYTFEEPGNYPYFCRPHEFVGMVGQIIVSPALAPGAAAVASGSIRPRDRVSEGWAVVYAENGSHRLRLEEFRTQTANSGIDMNVRVWLTSTLDEEQVVEPTNHIDLGHLAAPVGKTSYPLPDMTDFEEFKHVMILAPDSPSIYADADLEPIQQRPGDINNDGNVNAIDVQLVINAALGIEIEFDADINGDGQVNAVDVQLVINGALGV